MSDLSYFRKLLDVLYAALTLRRGGTMRANVGLSGPGIVSAVALAKGGIMAIVLQGGGPFLMDVSNFIDDKGNPVTDTDPATYTSSDESIATVTNNATDPQDGDITLVGPVSAEGTEVLITASFPAQRGGQPFSVTGHLTVIPRAAASATAVITGPGVVEGA